MQNFDWNTLVDLIKSGLSLAEAIAKAIAAFGG